MIPFEEGTPLIAWRILDPDRMVVAEICATLARRRTGFHPIVTVESGNAVVAAEA
jgi:hypothetical protein